MWSSTHPSVTSSSPFLKSSQLVRSPHERSSHFPVSASAPWTVKLLYKSTCMNHLETRLSFTQLGEKVNKKDSGGEGGGGGGAKEVAVGEVEAAPPARR